MVLKGLTFAAMVLVLAGCGRGLTEGEQCDPSLNSRDCAQGTSCVYSYEECPQYGCPKCRRQCRSNEDCETVQYDANKCEPAAECILRTNSLERGVCRICQGYRPWFPP